MVCMDLVGHALGPAGLPAEVRQTVFVLDAERSEGTAAHVDRLSVPGVVLRRVDAETIPPMSDYWAFWRKKVPFLFLSCGRWRHYHTAEDTPEKLDYAKMEALAAWLERFIRETCARPEPRIAFREGVRDDASTLRSLVGLGQAAARPLLAACGPDGRLPEGVRPGLLTLVAGLEESLA